MAYKITDACIACDMCMDVCDEKCISAGDIYVIDQDACTGCGECANICPRDACVPA